MHGGLTDPRELGRKGGKRSPLTKLRKAADDGLRDLARETLEKALRGEAVEKAQLDAARSLFAFRPAVPPGRGARVATAKAGPARLMITQMCDRSVPATAVQVW